MSARTIKWVIFAPLFLTVPVILYLVRVVMFMPAVIYLTGMLKYVGLAFVPGHTMQSLVIFVFLGVHVLLQAGLYYLIVTVAANAISWIPWNLARIAIVRRQAEG